MKRLQYIAEPDVPLISTEYLFETTPESLFAAFIEKELIEQWWVSAPGDTVRVDRLEAESGGRWQFTGIDAQTGQTYVFGGAFHEVLQPNRIIWTFEVLSQPERGHVSLERFDFVPEGSKTTKLRTTSVFLSLADRDWMLQSGTEQGLTKSYQRLEALVMHD